jgi:hypothetical protein
VTNLCSPIQREGKEERERGVRGSYRRLQRAVPGLVAAGGGVRSCGSGERGKWREVGDDRWDWGVGEREREGAAGGFPLGYC